MKHSKLSFLAMLVMATLGSCSDNNAPTSSEYVSSVRVTVEDFKPEIPTSRTAYTVDASGFHFQWAEGDALGIYPVGGDQVKFPISKGDGSASASFDGGAWKLRSEYQYAAYYPFSAGNYTVSESALPVNYVGQKQDGNGSTTHLGAYDYLACAATLPDANGGVDLTMKHLGAFVRFQLTMPKADTFSSVVLESDGAEFVTTGTFDLTAATPVITPIATSSTYTINLTNVATTERDQVITVYAIVGPANLSTSNITVTVHGIGKTTYVQTIQGKNFVARSAYNIAVDNFPSGTNASGQDVSWEGTIAEQKYIDLGIVGENGSPLYWAICNIGASEPWNRGAFFQWAGSIPVDMTRTGSDQSAIMADDYMVNIVWNTAPYQTNIELTDWEKLLETRWSKYLGSTSSKFKDASASNENALKTVLDLDDDAAHVNWGGNWRIPTKDEFIKLQTQCYWHWTDNYQNSSVSGYIVYKAKTDFDKGKFSFTNPALLNNYKLSDTHIFLPVTGVRGRINLYDTGNGYYWTSSLKQDEPYDGYGYYISSSNIEWEWTHRYNGRCVRAVRQ